MPNVQVRHAEPPEAAQRSAGRHRDAGPGDPRGLSRLRAHQRSSSSSASPSITSPAGCYGISPLNMTSRKQGTPPAVDAACAECPQTLSAARWPASSPSSGSRPGLPAAAPLLPRSRSLGGEENKAKGSKANWSIQHPRFLCLQRGSCPPCSRPQTPNPPVSASQVLGL